jgi:signal transduction histidine kinase
LPFQNAVDQNDRPVTVRVGALDGDGFYIADDGKSILADRYDVVFEYGHTTSDDGTGFGLAIVSELVEAHGWTISVTDSADGGTRFELRTTPAY